MNYSVSTIICRLCLTEQQNTWEKQMTNVLGPSLPDLSMKIQRCTSVQVTISDGLPTTICTTCLQMVVQFDVFREMCLYSDSLLRNKYVKNIPTENFSHLIKNQENNDYTSKQEFKLSDQTYIARNCCGDGKENNIDILNTHNLINERYENEVNKTVIALPILNKTVANNINNIEIFGNKVDDTSKWKNVNDDVCRNMDSSNNDFNYPTRSDSEGLCKNMVEMELTPPSFPKKRRKKRIINDNHSSQHLVIHLNKKNDVLGSERKVRIYKMDESMRQIIGENTYFCDICTKRFTSFFDYYDHQEMHNGQLAFKCNKCNEVFSERKYLVKHDARHKVPCDICKLEVLPKSMAAHLLIHTDIHKCSECGMRHTSKASLEKHIKARHTGIKGFVCHVCGKQSSCQSSMNRHMAYHSNERPYKCKYCDFCAKSLNIVQVHTSRRHFAEKCVCEICAKIFKSQPSLVQHMKRIHTTRKHICDICGKAFIERYNLTRHLKRHAGQRLHECKVCHKEFFTVRKLKEHMHSHRQGCVSCPKCGKEFFYKKYFNKHVQKCDFKNDVESDHLLNNTLCQYNY